MAVRITLSRKSGWKMPANTVKVDRTTRWGNPFTVEAASWVGVGKAEAPRFVVDCFADWLNGDRQHWMGEASDKAADWILENLSELRGKNLACWCKPGEPCHAEVLLELANKE